MDNELKERFDALESSDMLNRCNQSVLHRLFPVQSNWKEEESEQFKYFIENNE